MTQIPIEQLAPGMVVHLDTDILRTKGGALTCARNENGKDRAVKGPHYFLLLELDKNVNIWLACPLFSKAAAGSKMLSEKFKSGFFDKWRDKSSYYSAWQMWKIPAALIEAASGDDETTSTNRRMYAHGNETALLAIARDKEDLREPYRNV